MKKCKKCENELPLKNFSNDKRKVDNKCNRCKQCDRQYRLDNKVKLKAQKRGYYLNNIKKFQQKYLDNRDALIKSAKDYRDNNKDALAEKRRLKANCDDKKNGS